ncbi:MAG: hypothetical protein AAGC60_25660 [Acidobacteriota bacterium]
MVSLREPPQVALVDRVWDFTKVMWRLELLPGQTLGWATSANGDLWQPRNVAEDEIVRVLKSRAGFLYTSQRSIADYHPFSVVTTSTGVTPYPPGENPKAHHNQRGPGFWWSFPPFVRGAGSRLAPWVFDIEGAQLRWRFRGPKGVIWDPKMIVDPL